MFPTNTEVNVHNEKMQKQLSSNIFTTSAVHYFSQHDIRPVEPVTEQHIPNDDRNAGGTPSIMQVSIASRVMLIRNLNIETKENSQVSTIYVKFDNPHVEHVLANVSEHSSIGIEPYMQ